MGLAGYHGGSLDTAISVDDVNQQAKAIAETVTKEQILDLVEGQPLLQLQAMRAGYGKMEILRGIDLAVGKGQSLCLTSPNGAGKSTILHAIFGFCTVFSRKILTARGDSDATSRRCRPVKR